jgi:hypothetical protein
MPLGLWSAYGTFADWSGGMLILVLSKGGRIIDQPQIVITENLYYKIAAMKKMLIAVLFSGLLLSCLAATEQPGYIRISPSASLHVLLPSQPQNSYLYEAIVCHTALDMRTGPLFLRPEIAVSMIGMMALDLSAAIGLGLSIDVGPRWETRIVATSRISWIDTVFGFSGFCPSLSLAWENAWRLNARVNAWAAVGGSYWFEKPSVGWRLEIRTGLSFDLGPRS